VAKAGKLFGAGLGWALGGPIGAIIGLALGAVIDDSGAAVQKTGVRNRSTRGDFSASLMILVAAVLKADGRVLKAELDFIKSFFVKHFGVDTTREQMLILKELLQQDIPLEQVCAQIRGNMEYPSRLQLIHFLFGVSMADGQVHSEEVRIIEQIAEYMRIQPADFISIRSMFYADRDSDYKILEIDSNATDEEVRKAYRKMAVKYHPDKVSHLGEDYQRDAKEKFQKMQEAYENIKKERNMR
jgi:DnaJ like chaperone protein